MGFRVAPMTLKTELDCVVATAPRNDGVGFHQRLNVIASASEAIQGREERAGLRRQKGSSPGWVRFTPISHRHRHSSGTQTCAQMTVLHCHEFARRVRRGGSMGGGQLTKRAGPRSTLQKHHAVIAHSCWNCHRRRSRIPRHRPDRRDILCKLAPQSRSRTRPWRRRYRGERYAGGAQR
jgi:hypothetical protein